jgi:hypothetical protein
MAFTKAINRYVKIDKGSMRLTTHS